MTEVQQRLPFPAGSRPVETSEDAADALSGSELNERRMRVLQLFASIGSIGYTADEVVRLLGTNKSGDHNTWAPRVSELLKFGFLDRLDGKGGQLQRKLKRETRAGGTAFVHVINEKGRRALG